MIHDRLHSIRGLSTNDVLGALGLERRHTAVDVILPTAGVFIAGLMVGAGIALLVAPKSGQETRRELRGRATDLSHRLGKSIREEVEHRLPENGGKARDAVQTTK